MIASDFITGVWNPEDLVALPGTSWIVISAMRSERSPGCLFVIDPESDTQASKLSWPNPGEIDPSLFAPHGLGVRQIDSDRYELLVVDHGGGEAIDHLILSLETGTPTVIGQHRIIQPDGTSGNAVAPLPDGGFVMSSMFDPRDPRTLVRFARAEPTGYVWRWSPEGGWSKFGGLALSGANGIAASPDGSTILVCEWAGRRVWRLTADGTPDGSIKTPFLPDNLRWMPDGRLLLAGQDAGPEAVFDCEARRHPCPLGFEVAAIDPLTLDLECLVSLDHAEAATLGFGGATGALQVGRAIWVGSFTGDRIARFEAPIQAY